MFDILTTSTLVNAPALGTAIVLAILLSIILFAIAFVWLIGAFRRQPEPQMPDEWKNNDPFKGW